MRLETKMKNIINLKKINGLVPSIIQDFKTKEVYMLGYVNEESLTKTIDTGWIYFYSRTKNKLWMKGEVSGNKLKLKKIFIDCDRDTLLIKAELIGKNVCHTREKTCFKETI